MPKLKTLTLDIKIRIYRLIKAGKSIEFAAKKYGISAYRIHNLMETFNPDGVPLSPDKISKLTGGNRKQYRSDALVNIVKSCFVGRYNPKLTIYEVLYHLEVIGKMRTYNTVSAILSHLIITRVIRKSGVKNEKGHHYYEIDDTNKEIVGDVTKRKEDEKKDDLG